jgi:hypothetical protein
MVLKIPKGTMAANTIKAIEIADAMQGLAVATIAEEYSAEDEDTSLLFEDFVAQLEAATANGTRDQFEATLKGQLLPIIQAVMQQGQVE